MRTFAYLGVGVILLILILSAGSAAAVSGPAASTSPSAFHPFFVTKVKSTNWGGYAVTGSTGSVSKVAGSWVEPAAVSCTSTSTYASFWVGIDGYSSSTVEQTGTDSDCTGGVASYYAWYEFYPASYASITTVRVHAGDTISASVTYSTSTGKFTVKLTDVTTAKSFTKSSAVSGALRNSAEWITETPELCSISCTLAHLTDFGTVDFGTDHTGVALTDYATLHGKSLPIGNFTTIKEITITKSNKTTIMARPSSLSTDGTSFKVTWKNAGP